MDAVKSSTYMRVNSEATENLAKAAGKGNPDVQFIFFSSVSVYGEGPQITQITQNKKDVSRRDAKAQRGEEYQQVSQNEKDVSRKGDPQITQITQIKRTRKDSNIGVSEESECRPSIDSDRVRKLSRPLTFSCEKAKRVLGYELVETLEEGIRREVESLYPSTDYAPEK